MTEEEKTCDYPGCDSPLYTKMVEVRGENRGNVERFCYSHYRFISKHFSWWRESETFGHPTN